MMKILTEAMIDMSPDELKEIVEDLNLSTNKTSQRKLLQLHARCRKI